MRKALQLLITALILGLLGVLGVLAPAPARASYAPPPAPSELTAAAISGRTAGLTWKSNSGSLSRERFFIIYRKPEGGSYFPVATVESGVTIYTDKYLSPGTTYYYFVRAWNELGESISSEEVCITAKPPYGTVMSFQIGSPVMYANGESREIDPGKPTVPIIVAGKTYVPLASFAEAAGGTTEWNEKDNRITVQVKGTTVVFWQGRKTILVNGAKIKTTIPPITAFGRTMVSAELIANCFGGSVHWEDPACRATIILPK